MQFVTLLGRGGLGHDFRHCFEIGDCSGVVIDDCGD